MRIIGWFIQGFFGLTSAVATYLPLLASYRGWNMWGLAWQIWAMIGFTIFILSVASIIARLIWLYERPEAKLRRRKMNLEIEKLEAEKMSRGSPPNL